jgi:hypothetical protein
MADHYLVFKEASILFSKGVELKYIPTSTVWGLLFPESLPTFSVDGVFDDNYSNRSEVES